MRGWLLHRWTPLYLLLLALGGFVLFLYGFFPLEYQTGRHASRDQLPNFIRDVSIDGQTVYDTEETTAVLMVIDALRYDFVSEETMPYTWSLLRNGTVCEYVALAEPPTVTMPRIKSPERKREKAQWRRTINFWRDIFAMMTGRVSTFADVALNFGAPAVRGDSVPRAAAAAGRRAALYGDDTWLRLFPGAWADADGTTSFYVSDYTEVDDNVTRHLDRALLADEKGKPPFDLVVLHYLGLDHIGHLEGARSARVAPKLREMDDVVRKVFTAMRTWERQGVLMVCGDHGMREAGGHGGATSDELRVPLLLARTGGFQCPHKERPGPTVAQTDIAPSLAYLLRAPLPADSTGRVLPALLPADARQHLYLLHYNARENADALAAKIGRAALQERECYRQFRRAEEQFAEYLAGGQAQAGVARQARRSYEQALDEMGKLLAESTVKFDLFAMSLGVIVMLMITGALLAVTLHAVCGAERPARSHRAPRPAGAALAFAVVYAVAAAAVTLACAVAETASPVCSVDGTWTPIAAAVVAAMTCAFFVVKAGIERTVDQDTFKEMNVIDYLLIGGTAAHGFTFVGTSFIEEEHQTWRFLWSTLTLCVLARTGGALVGYATRRHAGATELQDKPRLREAAESVGTTLLPCWLLLVALHRFLRTLNQTGDRWAFLPDTADWLNEPANHVYLQALMLTAMAATFFICIWNLRHTNNMFQMNTAITIVATACILFYRVVTGALPAPHASLLAWDPVHVVNVFWGLMAAQVVFETLTFLGAYRRCCRDTLCAHARVYDAPTADGDAFVYRRRKEKSEDYESYEQEVVVEDTLTADEVKLKFARSLSHVALNTLALTLTLLARPHNVPLVPGAIATCALAAACTRRDVLPSAARAAAAAAPRRRALDALAHALLHHWIGWLFFFYQGNSNSLASVDLGAGYIGLREYSPVAVAVRLGLHSYAGPALAAMALFCMIAAQHDTWAEYKRAVWLTMSVLSLVRAYSLAAYACIAAGFRHHLFVWSVFSPKLLYDLAASALSVASLLTVAAILGVVHATHRAARYIAVRSL